MIQIEQIMNLGDIDTITYILKIFFISLMTYYTYLKIRNKKQFFNNKVIIIILGTIIIDIISTFIKYGLDSLTSIICLMLMLSGLYSIIYKENIGYSILNTIISLSINYIVFFISIILAFIPNIIKTIYNDYISLAIMIIIHITLLYYLFKIKKFKNGFSFLSRNSKNEYFDMLILNISVAILYLFFAFTSFDRQFTRKILVGFIIFSIIMFITIQKSFKLYYKQKLLIQDLKETKEELENKKKEVEQLEEENLNFSKISHSIAHKQKALEYKLNELTTKTEIGEELDLKDRLGSITKELKKETQITLSKTDIQEIDDMLQYMQAECIKNKINFDLQLNGNIHHMINNYISKENLEILIADHIKNAIIAINHSNNTNKSILVRLGRIDGINSLYVYDSGIEFEIDTLINLGKLPSSTHKDDGGTGMGFMNTFDTLKERQASMIIYEYDKPNKDNFTKVVIIKFDKKNEFKIYSYRSEEIKGKSNRDDLTIEKVNN